MKVAETIKKLTKEFEDIIKGLGLKLLAYRRGGRIVTKVYIPNEGWHYFTSLDGSYESARETMLLLLQEQLKEELAKRLNWEFDTDGRLQGNYISVAIYLTKKKTILVDFYLPHSEEPIATVRMEKLDLNQLEQLLRQADAWGVL
jgi:hypothetical protein